MATIAGKEIGPVGFGMMSLTRPEPAVPAAQIQEVLHTALKTGANFWNGGEFYGTPEYNSLHIANKYFTEHPEDADKVVLSIKGGMAASGERKPDGTAKNTRRCIDECLRVLDGKAKLAVWQNGRVDPGVPIEESMNTILEYVKKGLVGGASLSEPSAESIRRAAKIIKIEFVETEFGLFETTIIRNGVLDACRELNIPIVAHGVLGQGMLTETVKSPDDIANPMIKLLRPRFAAENFDQNLKLKQKIQAIAERKGCSVSQVAISWVIEFGKKPGMPPIIALPGASRTERVVDNSKTVPLSDEEMAEIDKILAENPVSGERYVPELNKLSWGNSPAAS